MKVLFVGDICGRPGRQAAQTLIPELRRELDLDFVIANGENAAGGVGLTPDILQEFLQQGVDVVTSGNHIWDKRDIFKCIDAEPRLLRPANYPSGTPGRGWGVFETPFARIAVVNLAGRVYMPPVDCPVSSSRRDLAPDWQQGGFDCCGNACGSDFREKSLRLLLGRACSLRGGNAYPCTDCG